MSTERALGRVRDPIVTSDPASATVAPTVTAADAPPRWAGILLALWAGFVYVSYALAYVR